MDQAVWEVEHLASAGQDVQIVDGSGLNVLLSHHAIEDLAVTLIAEMIPDGDFYQVVDSKHKWICKGNQQVCSEYLRHLKAELEKPPKAPDRTSQRHPEWHCQKHPEAEHQRHPMGITYCRECHPAMWVRCSCGAPGFRCCC